jgi:GNAT superfamily N-acetyltransferase
VRVRAFAEGDAGAISAILDETYGHDPRLRALHGGGHGPSLEQPFRRTSVAEIDGRVVAAGTIFHGSSHPLRTWIDLVVSQPFRRRGIGTAVLHELRAAAPASLCARVRFDQPGAAPFFRRHRFGLINRSWEGRFDPADVLPRLPEPRLGETPSREEAAAFFELWYREVHHWDPPAPKPLERALAQFCGGDMIPGSLVGIREDGKLVGAANVIRPPGFDPGDEVYLVWVGALGMEATDLVVATVRFAHDAGRAIRFEVDEPNVAVWHALNALGVLGEPALGFFAEV